MRCRWVEGTDEDTWSGQPTLNAGATFNCLVQDVDGTGDFSSSDNRGFFFEPVTYEIYLPLVMRGG